MRGKAVQGEQSSAMLVSEIPNQPAPLLHKTRQANRATEIREESHNYFLHRLRNQAAVQAQTVLRNQAARGDNDPKDGQASTSAEWALLAKTASASLPS